MGIISEIAGSRSKAIPGERDSVRTWNRIFRGTSKEEPDKPQGYREKPIPGGSYARTSVSSKASFARLLTAMRSRAPGGWSDDRWEQTRHFVGIQYVAIHRLAEQLSQAEFQVYEKDRKHPEGRIEVDSDHPLIRLLSKPNDEDSFADLMYRWAQQLSLTGMGLTWMVPNQLGQPYELYSIPTAIAIPQPAITPEYPNGFYRIQPVYPYGPFSTYPTPSSAVGAPIPAEWMLRFKYPHPLLRYEGYSPMTALRLHLDEIESIDRSRWHSMKRTINPSAVLNMGEMEGLEALPEEEIERIRAEFENVHMGDHNVGQLFVSTPGANLEPWGARPQDMEYQQGWDQLVSFALGGFGITKPAAGMVEDSSYSTLFATLKQLHLLTLQPICHRISSALTRDVATFFGDNLIVEVRCPRIDDHDVKSGKLSQLIQAKAITKNEIRQELDMPLTKEEWGEEMAGFEAPPEQPGGMPGMPGMEGMMGGGEEMPGMEAEEGEEELEADFSDLFSPGEGEEGLEDEGEVQEERMRPTPQKLGRGALGPRKSIRPQVKRLSIYEQVQKAIRNGNGKRK